MRSRIFFIMGVFLFLLGTSFAEEKSSCKLILKFDFEDEIKGNNSPVTSSASSGTQIKSKWGTVAEVTGRTWTAKNGVNWKPENRVKGKSGFAYSFGGDKEKRYIRVPYAESIDIDKEDFSISFWIKTTAEGGLIIIKTTTPPYWLLCLDKGKPKFLIRSADSKATNVVLSKKAVNDGMWHHVVFVARRNDDGLFYIDGKLEGEAPIKANAGSLKKKALIGIGGYGYQKWYFDGLLDSLRVYKGALSEKEIVTLFNEGK